LNSEKGGKGEASGTGEKSEKSETSGIVREK